MNFKDLDDLIHSGVKEIVLDSDIVHDDGPLYREGIRIDVDDLTVDGGGHTIDAGASSRIFFNVARNVTIKNITLKNGFVDFAGGAIYNEGELNMFNSKLCFNIVEGKGGAVYNEKSAVFNIFDSLLSNNSVKWNDGEIFQNKDEWFIMTLRGHYGSVEGSGGAIFNHGKMTINNSTFDSNDARKWGGAIRNLGDLEISDSSLLFNEAGEWGGAIDNSGNFKVLNCEISSNRSQDSIILNEDFMRIHNASFRKNSSKQMLFNQQKANLAISSGDFVGNDIEEALISNVGKSCTVENGIFENNLCPRNIVNFTDLTLKNPKIKDNGKSIYNEGYILIKNFPPELKSKIGGNGKVEVDFQRIPDDVKFDFGYLDRTIHEGSSAEIVLKEDIRFENYETDFYEGGIELDIDDLVIDGNGHVIDGAGKSRIFIITANNITIKNITFKNGYLHRDYDNLLNENGAGLRINHGLELTVINCRFINNESEKNGGAIHNKGKLNMEKCVFHSNASISGGAIYNAGEADISSSLLYQNTVNGKESVGGAIYNHGAKLNMSNCQLLSNVATEGGAIFNEESELNVSECIFDINLARDIGGAISAWNAKSHVSGCGFHQNLARNGGMVNNDYGQMELTDSKFNQRISKKGNGLIIFNGGELKLDSVSIKLSADSIGELITNYSDSKLTVNNLFVNDCLVLEENHVINNYISSELIFKSNITKY